MRSWPFNRILVMIQDLLKKNKAAILEKWFHFILETYPADSAALMRKDRNQFTNPVGATISREIEALFNQLCEGVQNGSCRASLDAILKIRSVQDFSPSKAVGFIFLLKRAVTETLKDQIFKERASDEWLSFQSRIDDLTLLAFDAYMHCREKVCEIRINQAKAEKETAFRMMERMTYSKEKLLKKEGSDS
jgi:hypothetical protein